MSDMFSRVLKLIVGIVCIIIGVCTFAFLPLAIIMFIIGIPHIIFGTHGIYNVLRGREVNANEEHWHQVDPSVHWPVEFEARIRDYTDGYYSVNAFVKGKTIIVEATLNNPSQEWRESKVSKAYKEVAKECPFASKLYIYN